MAHDEQHWREKANSLQAQLDTLKGQMDPIIERYTTFKANMGVKEKSDGSISIDFDKFVERLGPEGWAALRKIGDEKHGTRPEPSGITYVDGDTLSVAPPTPAEVLAPLVGKTVTILAVDGGKPKLRIHRKAA